MYAAVLVSDVKSIAKCLASGIRPKQRSTLYCRRAQGGRVCLYVDFPCFAGSDMYYLRLFRALVAVVAGCWLVNPGICTGGLSEKASDV